MPAETHHIEGVIALLHVMMLAYVKIDKLYEGPDLFEEGLVKITAIAREIVLQNGLNGLPVNRRDIWRITIVFPACVICLIAGQPREIGRVMGLLHYCYRQVHIPLFFYFQRRWHIFVGTVMATISITLFFGLAYILIWEINPPDPAVIKAGFWTMVGFILWLVVTNSAALLLPRLGIPLQISNI
jgi:hypothetical protein